MQLSELAKELQEIIKDESINLSLNIWARKDGSSEVQYQLYVSNKNINKYFKTYTELERFTTFLIAGLKEIDVSAVENSVEKAYELMKTEGTVVL